MKNIYIILFNLLLSWYSTSSQWIQYTGDNTIGIKGSLITSIINDKNGDYWLATDKGIVRYKNAHSIWEEFDAYNSLNSEIIYQVFEDSKGDIWIAHNGSGLSRYHNNTWTNFTTKDGLNSTIYRAIGETENYVWFGSYTKGITRYSQDSGFSQPDNEEFTHMQVSCLLGLNSDSLVIGTFDKGINLFVNENVTSFNTTNGLISNHLFCLKKNSKNEIWVGTEAGAQIFDLVSGTFLPVPDSLSGIPVYSIAEDNSGSMHFGSQGKVIMKTNNSFSSYLVDNQSNTSNIHAINLSDKKDWYGTSSNGLYISDGLEWVNFIKSEKLTFTKILALTEDQQQNIIFSDAHHLYIFDGLNWKTIEEPNVVKYWGNDLMFCDSRSYLWVERDLGVSVLIDTVWQYFNRLGGEWIDDINEILEDSSGNVWLSTNYNGLFMWNGQEGHHYGQGGSRLYSNQTSGMDIDSDGKLYVAHSDVPVISYFDGNNWDYIFLDTLGTYIRGFLIDMSGHFWVTTYNGIFEIIPYVSRPRHFGHPYPYKIIHHLGNFEFSSYRIFNGIYEDDKGNIWAIEDGSGISHYNGSKWVHYYAFNGIGCNGVRDFLCDSKGQYWLATDCGLYKADYLFSPVNLVQKETVQLTLFPNPVQEKLNITFENFDLKKIIINVYTIDGRQIAAYKNFQKQELNNQIILDTQSWPVGFLIVSVKLGEQVFTKKILKISNH